MILGLDRATGLMNTSNPNIGTPVVPDPGDADHAKKFFLLRHLHLAVNGPNPALVKHGTNAIGNPMTGHPFGILIIRGNTKMATL